MALNGIQLMLNYEVIPQGDVKNILRVLMIQINSGKTENHLKIIQIVLLLINLLSSNENPCLYMTESTINSLIVVCLQICESRSSVSIATTALAASSQIVSVVINEVQKQYSKSSGSDAHLSTFIGCAKSVIIDLTHFCCLQPGVWIKNVCFPQANALDLLFDILSNNNNLFVEGSCFYEVFINNILPSLKVLLRKSQDDFVVGAYKTGIATSASISSRIIRLARCILINYISHNILDDCNFILTLLFHTLQPLRTLPSSVAVDESIKDSIFSSSASFMSKFGIPNNQKATTVTKPINNSTLYLSVVSNVTSVNLSTNQVSSQNVTLDTVQIPIHPAGACLETLLSFFLSDLSKVTNSVAGAKFISDALINTIINVSILLTGSLAIESNCR